MQNRYTIAKYVPDVFRFEPRNIGVIFWAMGGIIDSRFLTPEQAQFVSDKKNYQRWLDYWRRELELPEIRPRRSEPVARTNSEFLAALELTGKDNYILMGCGQVGEEVTPGNIERITDELFQQLVSIPRV